MKEREREGMRGGRGRIEEVKKGMNEKERKG